MRLTGIFFQNEVGFIQSSFFVKAQSYQLVAARLQSPKLKGYFTTPVDNYPWKYADLEK